MSLTIFAIISFQFVGYISCSCVDINGLTIPLDMHFIAGPDKCLLCVCGENDLPKWCKKILCNPPEKCKSFIMGNSCCDFICTDTTLVHDPKDDMDRKFIISVTTAFFILTLMFFIINKLRQRNVVRGLRPHRTITNRRNVGNIGFITGGVGYLNIPHEHQFDDNPMAHFSVYKPHGSFFTSGEAPPPYDEVVNENPPFSTAPLSSHMICSSNLETATSSHQHESSQMENAINESQNGQHEENSNRLVGNVCRHTTIPLMLRVTNDESNTEVQQRNNLLATTFADAEGKNMLNCHSSAQINSGTALLSVPSSSSNFVNSGNVTEIKFLPRVIKASLSAPLPSSISDNLPPLSTVSFASSQNLPTISKYENSRNHEFINIDETGKMTITDVSGCRVKSRAQKHISKKSPKLRTAIEKNKNDANKNISLDKQPISGILDDSDEVNKMSSHGDYHAECENCNVNSDSAVVDGSGTEQETMTLQRHINDGKNFAEQLLNVSLTLPTNSRVKREVVSKSKISSTIHSSIPKSRLENVSSGDEDES